MKPLNITTNKRSNTRTARHGQARHNLNQAIDGREQLGQSLLPYARFDKDIERFCCTACGAQFETFRGINAHLAEELAL